MKQLLIPGQSHILLIALLQSIKYRRIVLNKIKWGGKLNTFLEQLSRVIEQIIQARPIAVVV
jgi:hypothetical protein